MHNKKSNERVARLQRPYFLLIAALFSAGSFAQSSATIQFDAAGCPQAPVADVSGVAGAKISWQAVDLSGAATTESFEIFFDPISGGSLKAPRGSLQRPIDSKAPKALYKYTIVGSRCTDKPLDPNFRVD